MSKTPEWEVTQADRRALTAARRNVYQLQMGGDRLCEALRKISVGTDAEAMAQIAKKALGHREPEPDWREIDVAALAAPQPPALDRDEVERARIVAWLREQAEEAERAGSAAAEGSWDRRGRLIETSAIRNLADAIERGDHLT